MTVIVTSYSFCLVPQINKDSTTVDYYDVNNDIPGGWDRPEVAHPIHTQESNTSSFFNDMYLPHVMVLNRKLEKLNEDAWDVLFSEDDQELLLNAILCQDRCQFEIEKDELVLLHRYVEVVDEDYDDYGDTPEFTITDREFSFNTGKTRDKRGTHILAGLAGVFTRIASAATRVSRMSSALSTSATLVRNGGVNVAMRGGTQLVRTISRTSVIGRVTPELLSVARAGGQFTKVSKSFSGVNRAMRWMKDAKIMHPICYKMAVGCLGTVTASGVSATVFWYVTDLLTEAATRGDLDEMQQLVDDITESNKKLSDKLDENKQTRPDDGHTDDAALTYALNIGSINEQWLNRPRTPEELMREHKYFTKNIQKDVNDELVDYCQDEAIYSEHPVRCGNILKKAYVRRHEENPEYSVCEFLEDEDVAACKLGRNAFFHAPN